MSVREAQGRIGGDEFLEWMAYFTLYPLDIPVATPQRAVQMSPEAFLGALRAETKRHGKERRIHRDRPDRPDG